MLPVLELAPIVDIESLTSWHIHIMLPGRFPVGRLRAPLVLYLVVNQLLKRAAKPLPPAPSILRAGAAVQQEDPAPSHPENHQPRCTPQSQGIAQRCASPSAFEGRTEQSELFLSMLPGGNDGGSVTTYPSLQRGRVGIILPLGKPCLKGTPFDVARPPNNACCLGMARTPAEGKEPPQSGPSLLALGPC